MSTSYSAVLAIGITLDKLMEVIDVEEEVIRYNENTGEPYTKKVNTKKYYWLGEDITNVEEYKALYSKEPLLSNILKKTKLKEIHSGYWYLREGILDKCIIGIKVIDTESIKYTSLSNLKYVYDVVMEEFEKLNITEHPKIYTLHYYS